MRWFALPLVAFAVALTVPAQAAPPAAKAARPPAAAAPQGRLAALAPADMYFGPFGMSPLSIRSTIGLLGREYHQRAISDHDLLRKALVTEDALRQWRGKFPADPWLAPTFLHLEQLYQAVQTDEARKHATAILKDIVSTYPATKEGHLSRSRLAAGFPALVPESPLVATPAPPAEPTAAPDQPQPAASVPAAAPPVSVPSPAALPAGSPAP